MLKRKLPFQNRLVFFEHGCNISQSPNLRNLKLKALDLGFWLDNIFFTFNILFYIQSLFMLSNIMKSSFEILCKHKRHIFGLMSSKFNVKLLAKIFKIFNIYVLRIFNIYDSVYCVWRLPPRPVAAC